MTPYEVGKYTAIKTAGINPATLKNVVFPGMEIAGLGMLAATTADKMRSRKWLDSRTHENRMNSLDLAGLGTLAVPSAFHMAEHFKPGTIARLMGKAL